MVNTLVKALPFGHHRLWLLLDWHHLTLAFMKIFTGNSLALHKDMGWKHPLLTAYVCRRTPFSILSP